MSSNDERDLLKEPVSLPHKVLKALIDAGRDHRNLMERRLNKTGVYRGQHHLLMDISRFPDASQKELAEMGHISGATVAASSKKLEKGGYIEREVDVNDNRCNQIRMTEKGMEVVKHSIRIFQRTETELLDGFTKEEQEQLLSYLARISRNIKKASEKESEGKKDEAL